MRWCPVPAAPARGNRIYSDDNEVNPGLLTGLRLRGSRICNTAANHRLRSAGAEDRPRHAEGVIKSSFMSASLPSFAKINLGLRIGSLRADGFHELRTVYQTLALHDTI